MRIFSDVPYGAADFERVDFYLPDTDGFATLIWFHGGGLESGNRKCLDFAADFTKRGVAVASVEYRLYPAAHFPDYLRDAASAVAFCAKWLPQNGGSGGIFISGQSAGAYITAMLAVDAQYLKDVGLNPTDFAGFISDSAQMTVHFNVLRERGLDARLERLDEAAPLYFLSPECTFGKMLVIAYEADMPCRKRQNQLFVEAAQRLCPQNEIRFLCLAGGHVNGSTARNENGCFDFVEAALKFITKEQQ